MTKGQRIEILEEKLEEMTKNYRRLNHEIMELKDKSQYMMAVTDKLSENYDNLNSTVYHIVTRHGGHNDQE